MLANKIDIIGLMAGLGFLFIPFMGRFKIRGKIIFMLCGIFSIIISFLERTELINILGSFFLIVPFIFGKFKSEYF